MIKESEISIAVIGLGYVGLPLAVEFTKKYPVIGYDLNNRRIQELKKGYDRTGEVDAKSLGSAKNLLLSSDPSSIKNTNVYIVTVPTPVDKNNIPNLKPLESASELVGSVLSKGNVVIYESTVFPGATEEICVPILNHLSSLTYNIDFFCGYSPERINPGDKEHTLTNIVKITSGSNSETSNFVMNLYKSIIKAGVFQATTIAVAEAAKVIENTQRDVNIALINELALIFNRMNINTKDVLRAARTKWNFLPFDPGLVGGHCIGVDPYYLTHKAVEIGYKPEIILAGRRINDSMGEFIAEQTILNLIKNNVNPSGAKLGILGLTFKENCPDLRNTKVVNIIKHLQKYDCEVLVSDEFAIKEEAKNELNVDLISLNLLTQLDSIILAVSHNSYKDFKLEDWERFLKPNSTIMDIKSIYAPQEFEKTGYTYWSL